MVTWPSSACSSRWSETPSPARVTSLAHSAVRVGTAASTALRASAKCLTGRWARAPSSSGASGSTSTGWSCTVNSSPTWKRQRPSRAPTLLTSRVRTWAPRAACSPSPGSITPAAMSAAPAESPPATASRTAERAVGSSRPVVSNQPARVSEGSEDSTATGVPRRKKSLRSLPPPSSTSTPSLVERQTWWMSLATTPTLMSPAAAGGRASRAATPVSRARAAEAWPMRRESRSASSRPSGVST